MSQLTPDQFAEQIKAKYPAYANVDNATLTQKMLAKYPQYADRVAPEVQTQKGPGLVQSVVRGVASPFLRLGANAIKAGKVAVGMPDDPTAPVSYGDYLGSAKPVGMEGSALQKAKDITGTALDVASNAVGGGGAVNVAKAGFKGLLWQGVKAGAKAGAIAGAIQGAGGALQDNAGVMDTGIRTAEGTLVGTALGSILGVAVPIGGKTVRGVPGAINAATHPVQAAEDAARSMGTAADNTAITLMNKVARINPSDVRSFSRMAGGATPGQYLHERGIYGSTQEVTAKLFQRFSDSKQQVDDALEKLPGLYKNKTVETALQDVVGHAEATSAEGAPSPYLDAAKALLSKAQSEGLTQSEINAAKRLFERTVKLNYIKDGVSAPIERANNIDNAIRSWQQQTADNLGFKNIRDLNKETQLAKMLIDAIAKKQGAQVGNNIVGLTDWIVASGIPADPHSIAMLLGKKAITSSKAQGSIASLLSRGAKVGAPRADVTLTDPNLLRVKQPATRLGPEIVSDTSGVLPTERPQPQPNYRLALPTGKPGTIPGPTMRMGPAFSQEKSVPHPVRAAGEGQSSTQPRMQPTTNKNPIKSIFNSGDKPHAPSSNDTTLPVNSKNNSGKATIGTITGAGAVSTGLAAGLYAGHRGTTISAIDDNTQEHVIGGVNINRLRKALMKNETGGVKTDPYTFSKKSGSKTLGRDLGAYQVTEGELKENAGGKR